MRHKKAKKRLVDPDRIYQSRLVEKFINKIMKDGKKTTAQRQFYDAMKMLEAKSLNPIETFEKAVANVGPRQEVRPRRVGGASYQIPVEVRGERKTSLAVRWLIASARGRSNKESHSFAQKLAAEFMDASQNMGAAIKKRDTVQRIAEANRAFAHFRW